jgi:hypothetical protein
MKNIMIDIETMGNSTQAAIVQIGAMFFDPLMGSMGPGFLVNVDLESNFKYGMKADGSTIMWWLNQSQPARDSILRGQSESESLPLALTNLGLFCDRAEGKPIVWSNGASFDIPILTTAYRNTGLSKPWDHWDERCVRTIAELRPGIKKMTVHTGTKHSALDDCKYQIAYLCATLKTINGHV